MHQYTVTIRSIVSITADVRALVDQQHLQAARREPFRDDGSGKPGADN
jgi:hypothetical protein